MNTYPKPIPSGTAVPSWAYLNVVDSNNVFNYTAAREEAGQNRPESYALAPSSTPSSTPSFTPSTTPSSTPVSSPSVTTPPSSSASTGLAQPSDPAPHTSGFHTNIGAIVGGVVGALGGIAIISTLLFSLWPKRRKTGMVTTHVVPPAVFGAMNLDEKMADTSAGASILSAAPPYPIVPPRFYVSSVME